MPLILENAPDVAFSEVAGLFIASFRRPIVEEPTQETTQETTQEPPGDTKAVLLRYLRQQPRITTQALAQATGLTSEGVKYHLTQLKRTGKLRRHGPTKGGHWEVIG